MKLKRYFGLILILAIAVSSLGIFSWAVELQGNGELASDIERSSGSFNTTISAGKIRKSNTSFSLIAGESVNFNATYYSSSASVDFGVLDSNNVFTYINVTTGSVNAGVTVTASGVYTPAIRNNSSDSISVTGIITTGLPSTN